MQRSHDSHLVSPQVQLGCGHFATLPTGYLFVPADLQILNAFVLSYSALLDLVIAI